MLLFEALTPVNSLFVFSKFPVIARAIASFDPPGKSLMSLILSETWRRIRCDLWIFFKISLLAGNLAFIADRF